jgi:aminoglycoside/choline kinase family phosphotransferase
MINSVQNSAVYPLDLIEKEANKLGKIIRIEPISSSGSNRYYAIIYYDDKTILGCYNGNVKENEAFIYFSNLFYESNLPVPHILHVSDDKTIYFQTYISELSLFDLLKIKNFHYDNEIVDYYLQALQLLQQFNKFTDIDFSKTYPKPSFDSRSIRWDLNYFKYNFLKIIDLPFDEDKLENDFEELENIVFSYSQNYLSLRDYQSANLMLNNNKVYVIDFQGARIGSQMYDVAALLFDSKAQMPNDIREQLLLFYLNLINSDNNKFSKLKDEFYWIALFRQMQALGTFGYRGLIQHKPSFTSSIPFGVNNLEIITNNLNLNNLVELPKIFEILINKYHPKSNIKKVGKTLNVKIFSFSIKNQYPPLDSEHGGGFVFDCRCLANPGRLPEMEKLNGKDKVVIEMIKSDEKTQNFLNYIFNTISLAINEYLERGYTLLQISFGCTGGQHRSVYCADEIARRLDEYFGEKIIINISHLNI